MSMWRYSMAIALCTACLPLTIAAQDVFNALSWKNTVAYNAYLMREVHRQNLERESDFEKALTSEQSLLTYITDSKARYKSIVGQFPAKQALNPQITGIVQGDGFRIEKIVFESLPGRYVTANLYMPQGQGKPVPAALEFCGHSFTGKIPASQSALLMAANGIAVLVVDPIGQGERLQLIDESGAPLTRGATTEHTLLNAGLNLLGTSLAAQEFWDNHRALDYLLTREDIDSERIGIYGSSGGGTQASYFIGLDDRIKVAAICSYFSNRERTLELQGPSDGCQHIPYEGREKLELAEFALMMVPKPLLILAGKYDFVDLWGAQQGYKQLQKAYTKLGISNKLDMLTVEDGHGLREEKRYKLVSWFKQWLLNSNKSTQSPFKIDMDRKELMCTPSGQVNTAFSNALSLMQENANQFKLLETERLQFQRKGQAAIRKQVLSLLGGDVVSEAPLRSVLTRQMEGRGYMQYNYQLIREGEMPIPCVLIIPETATAQSPVQLCLFEEGKSTFLNEFTNITAALTEGTILLAADLRGLGKTADPAHFNDAKYWNFEYRNSMISMHIGKPILGQRVTDLITLLDFCSEYKALKGRPIHVRATGVYGPIVVHAAYLDKRIELADITKSIKSWQSYLTHPMQRDMYSNVLYGVLRYYDLPDLIRLTGRSIRISD